MIPPRGEWHRFLDDKEKLDYLRSIDLIPRTKELRPIYYNGPYAGTTEICDVVGYVSPHSLVIEIDGELHCIHPDLLMEMQVLNVSPEYQVNYISHPDKSPMDFVVYDFETTNLSHRIAEIIEIGAVKYVNGEQVGMFKELVRPMNPIPAQIQRITGITNEMVSNQAPIEIILPRFVDFCGNLPLIAYNGAAYDFKILERKCSELKIQFSPDGYDAMHVARRNIKCPTGNKLENLKEYLNIETISHRALEDSLVTAEVWKRCFPKQFHVQSPPTTQKPLKKGPAKWPETQRLESSFKNALEATGLSYDFSIVSTENRPQKSGDETEALLVQNSTVFVIKGKKTKVITFTERFSKIFDSLGVDYKKMSDGLRITPHQLIGLLLETNLAQLLYEACLSDADSFSCCAYYEKCSDAKKCIQTDPMFYARCHYRDNLKAGRIFYGVNKTI